MKLLAILRKEDIALSLPAGSKAAVLDAAADRLSKVSGLAKEQVLGALADRERMGSTAINHGVCVPHARMEVLNAPAAVFARLEKPIDFDAVDNKPVDLVFAVIWPSDKKDGLLATLGELCRSLREPAVLHALREASDADEIVSVLTRAAEQNAAKNPKA